MVFLLLLPLQLEDFSRLEYRGGECRVHIGGEGLGLLIPVPHLSFFFLLSFTTSLGSMNLASVMLV